MDIRQTIAQRLKLLMRQQGLTLAELSRQWDIPLSSMKIYASGRANLRSDTIELLADRLGLSPSALLAQPSEESEQAEAAVRAAQLFAALPPERRSEALALFLQLTALFSPEKPEQAQ